MQRATLTMAMLVLAVVQCPLALAASEVADAAMQRDQARLKQLLQSSADVNAAQPDGSSALHWAAYHGDAATAVALLAAGAKSGAVTETGITPLALACETGSAAVVALLLEAGADANQTLHNGETPLMMAARNGRVPVLETLLAHGAQLELRDKQRGTTALMWAAANSNAAAVRALLQAGADFGARSGNVAPGRKSYLAPPGRERIQEFIDGKGFRGAAAEGEGAVEASVAEAQKRAARAEVAKLPVPPPYSERGDRQWGGLTPLLFAAREGDMESVLALLDAGADVNQTSDHGWTALLAATQNRSYKLGARLLERRADPNLANDGGWNALYLATDNRNIEGGDYPTRKPDMDHLQYIRLLLKAGANPNLRMRSSTETRTVFTNQWLYEEGATPFLRAAQSGDLELMKLLLAHGADAGIPTDHKVTPLMVASGIGWVEGVTYEWSPQATFDTVKLLLDMGADVNAQEILDGRTALMGAAHKGRNDVVQLLVDRGADLALHDIGSRDSIFAQAGVTWQAIDYADGLVRVGVQSSIAHEDTAALLRRMMKQRGLPVPAEGRTLASICITAVCK